ncbi:hypothetical protein [Streptomyces sp. NPDC127100]
MRGDELVEKVQDAQSRNDDLPVQVVNHEGDILDIASVSYSGLNGGSIHITVSEPDE